jgi:type IV pilus assembly protein PilV
MTNLNTPGRVAAQGFTLVEVMVALIIISVGMLGIAKMQGLALSSTNASRSRALASIEASSLASAMQANRAYWSSSGSLPGSIIVTTSAGTPTIAGGSATLQAALSTAGGTLCSASVGAKLSCYCTTVGACASYVNMAASDLYDWSWTLASFLPNATATVGCNDADLPVDCTITIGWNENTVALTTQQAANSAAGSSTIPVSYTLYVVP